MKSDRPHRIEPALRRLEEFAAVPDPGLIEKLAIVKAFEYTVEEFVSANSPSFLPAEAWGAIKTDRDTAADPECVNALDELVGRIRSDHLPILRRLAEGLSRKG